ncbi:hypothetical protein HED60_04165 [Planctomycetales bacterium ZRK34]|nr:hypothetical protein HED60_04165 [Planctomycetales bacterium ZRK34]
MPISADLIVRTLMRKRPQLLAYTWAILRDNHLSEDVLQEVSVLAIHKADQIDDEAHLHRWLRQACRYKALNLLQKLDTHTLTLDGATLDAMESRWAAHDNDNPADLADALAHCLGELSPYAQRLVKLRYRENMTGQRLATAVGRQINTVYVALTRIHRALGECIRSQLNHQKPPGNPETKDA